MNFLKSTILALCVFFVPIQGLFLAVGLTIFLDTITGIFRSVKVSGWASIRSRRLSDLAGKVLLYNFALITVYVVDLHLIGEFLQVWFTINFLATKCIAMVLIFIEVVSIKENFEEAFKMNLWALLRKLLTRGKEIKKDITEIIN